MAAPKKRGSVIVGAINRLTAFIYSFFANGRIGNMLSSDNTLCKRSYLANHFNKEKKKAKYGNMSFGKSKTIRPEINLIGKDLDEATDLMNKYIDDAFLAGLVTVHIIHGRGEGILRKGLRAELSRNKHVKSYKSAPYNDGGEGCTIVELRGRK
jgi:DNA-nicking Smr family endonuclease